MDRPDAWMPHYIGDYLIETVHLTPQQDGIYMRLRAHYWKNAGPIPADMGMLYRAARASSPQEMADVEFVLRNFFKMDGDCIRHAELDNRYQQAWEVYKKRSEAGKKAVAAREQKRLQRSNDASADEQTRTITRTRTEKKNEKKNHQLPVDAPKENAASTNMGIEEFERLHEQTFSCVLNKNHEVEAAKICKQIPKEKIEEVFKLAKESGIHDFTHVLRHLRSLSDRR